MTKIHPTAIIGTTAEIGADVEIGPYSVIGDDVRIGDACVIGPHVVIHPYTTLGQRCRVHAMAVLGDLPQDLSFPGGATYVDIGNDCVIREGVTVHRGTKPETRTVIGNQCFLMAFSHFAHNVQLGDRVIVANAALLAGYVEVGEGAFISGTVVIHQFVKIGRLAMLGGQSGIGKDIPPFCTTESSERNRIAGLNLIGLKRAGFTPSERKEIKRAFEMLYRSGLNTSQALEKMKAEFPEGPAGEIWRFIEKSDRGICGAIRES
ncbi:MAG: acyl-ACP--UDP-N-acetylglucosamine O-acyltransferase [Kiritimatiellae bacterium]|nr:acyl-ACP--UDP-N-acetylglucosamine O-acyltransferase [Kiritimatiellia bacterium]